MHNHFAYLFWGHAWPIWAMGCKHIYVYRWYNNGKIMLLVNELTAKCGIAFSFSEGLADLLQNHMACMMG